MTQSKILIIVLITLIVGFGAGFVLRPVIAPTGLSTIAVNPPLPPDAGASARSTQYFAVHLDEARRIAAGCREGSVRSEECANAQQAVTEAEGRDRFKKFMGH